MIYYCRAPVSWVILCLVGAAPRVLIRLVMLSRICILSDMLN